jgi:glycosyltransferase involved in cell wall biosynthesis
MGRGFGEKEICYLHTPPRYLYGFDTSRKLGIFAQIYGFFINPYLRWYDRRKMRRVGTLVVNSKNVGKRVEKIYGRKNYKVIYPPVELKTQSSEFKTTTQNSNFYLAGGRNARTKNFGLVERACKKAGVELKMFGDPPVSEEELTKLYAGAKAFIVAQKDFGITPLEANAVGCPVIAYCGGGYLETVVDRKTGIFFDKLTVSSLVKAIKKSEKIKFDKRILIDHAKKFGKERFKREILMQIDKSNART